MASKKKNRKAARAMRLESLEERRLLTVADDISVPFITLDSPGTLSYDGNSADANYQVLSFDDAAVAINYGGGNTGLLIPRGLMSIRVKVDSAGHLISGVTGDDFVIKQGTNTLLSGEVAIPTAPDAFTITPSGGNTLIEFKFIPTGGTANPIYADSTGLKTGVPLKPNYFDPNPTYPNGADIGVTATLTPIASLDFSGLGFTYTSANFVAKGFVGALPKPANQPPGIDIEKTTNGPTNSNPTAPDYDNEDAMNGPGVPILTPGSTVTWKYQVTNTGGSPFNANDVIVTDDNGTPGNTADDFQPTLIPSSDLGNDGILSPGEVWLYTASGTVQTLNGACYENKATVVVVPSGLTDSDLSHYCNPPTHPAIDIEKYVKPVTTQTTGGQGLTPGFWKQSQHFQFWTNYTTDQNYDAVFGLTAPHNDDTSLSLLGALQRGGGANNALGRHAVAALLNASNPNINFAFTPAQVIALVQNAYATGDYETAKNTLAAENEKEGVDLNNPTPAPSPSPTPGYGDDADLPTGPVVDVGTMVQFTFVVTNTGDVPLTNVIVTDNNETPSDTSDDFHPTAVLEGAYNVGDDNHDGNLDVGEVWLYTWTKVVTAGQHTNTATVVGTPAVGGGSTVTDSDDANWLGNSLPPPPSGSITGKKFLDITGNGLTSDDTLWNSSLPTVTIQLYKDAGTIGTLDGADTLYTTTTVLSNGTYSFTNLPVGNYLVKEVVPSGYLRTAPLFADYAAVNVSAAQAYTGPTFDNVEKCDSSDYSNVKFYINNSSSYVTDIRGKTHEGDTVKVVFTVPAGHEVHHFAFVSYTAPASYFDANTASQQQIYELAEGDFGPGTYCLTVHAPNCYYQLDFVCGYAIDKLGPANSNIFYTPQSRLISADNGGIHSCSCCSGGSISGFVFLDQNNDGEIDFGEQGIKNVKVTLTNRDTHVVYTSYTDTYGAYSFDHLPTGNYDIEETQPNGYLDGQESAGDNGGSAFTVSDNKFSNVRIQMCDDDNDWNFGEQLTAGGTVSSGQTATIGFWQNKNGQALLKCLNGGSTSTKLGNWLAEQFPNLFGANAGCNNLTGKTNSQVASFFVTQFKVRGVKIEAQVLAVAFAVYVTDSGTAGTVATQYGFKVDSVGVGNATFNVGTNGAAFGVANGTVLTVNQILLATDTASIGGSTAIYNGDTLLQGLANNVYDAINNAGDIG